MSITKYCVVCWEEQTHMSTCGRCRTVLYCSTECQKKHWPIHKLTCNKEQKEEGRQAKQIIRIVSKNENFMNLISMLCGLYWSSRAPLVCLFFEQDPMI